MHPATPLIPAIWSSSKHAGDVKNPLPRHAAQQGPPNQNGWGEYRKKESGECRSVAGKGGGGGTRWRLGVGSGMCHPHIPAALLLINFSHDQL